MLGVDPTKADDDFKITRFWMENGEPKFEFSHSADGSGNSFVPRLKVKGMICGRWGMLVRQCRRCQFSIPMRLVKMNVFVSA